ncbi:NAD-dependent epimerase/dehydratase family protein [Nakamurella sp. GG22]
MRIVIVGASGNVGTALLRLLASGSVKFSSRKNVSDDPPVDVIGVTRRTPPSDTPYDVARWHSVDISAPAAADRLVEVFDGADAVVNLAWGFQPTHDADRLERVGVGGLRAVAQASARAGVGQLVHMSSVGAYRRAERGQRVDESWPTDGVPSSVYSRHKAAAERILDDFESGPGAGTVVTRFRPGIVLQRAAGSALLRYGVPGYVPSRLITALPLLPLDRNLAVPVVHADDLAAAVLAAVERRADGAFNIAAEPVITRDDIAAALGSRPVQFPAPALRAVVAATWHAHLQRIDAGWIDLAFAVPALDTTRARTELGWQPAVDARDALREVVAGMRDAASTSSPVLRRRTVLGSLTELVRQGPITRRSLS